ncbi:MAG: RteC domain-containing protein [Chitinophagaceae bacterium]
MSCQWETRFAALQQALKSCEVEHTEAKSRIECCFFASCNAGEMLLRETAQSMFGSTDFEIKFFKEVKPRFFSEVEYYRLMYHATLFEPTDEEDKQREFWQREGERLSKFIRDNGTFYDYVKTGSTQQDEAFFTQCEAVERSIPLPWYREREVLKSSHDHLVSIMLALDRYDAFVRQKLQECD